MYPDPRAGIQVGQDPRDPETLGLIPPEGVIVYVIFDGVPCGGPSGANGGGRVPRHLGTPGDGERFGGVLPRHAEVCVAQGRGYTTF